MAISLGFGIIFATSIILVIIPWVYMILNDILKKVKKQKEWGVSFSGSWNIGLPFFALSRMNCRSSKKKG